MYVYTSTCIHISLHTCTHTYCQQLGRQKQAQAGILFYKQRAEWTQRREMPLIRKDEDWELTTDMTGRKATVPVTGAVRWNGWYGKTQLV